MGILPTNTLLVKYKIKDNSLCDLCNNNEETTSHLFWECTKTQIHWHNLTEFLKTKNITFEITRLEALLVITNGTHCYIKNLLTILMKRFIYLMKLNKRNPSFTIFLNYIKERMKIESLIALSKDKFGIHSDLVKIFN